MIIWQDENSNAKIDALTRLVPKKQFALMALNNICNEHDGTFSVAETEPGFKPDRHFRSFFLFYEGKRLTGELFLFLTDADRAEITAIVDPYCRRRGVFTKLLEAANEELEKYGVKEKFFVAEPDCEDAKKVIDHLNLNTHHYELVMGLNAECSGKAGPDREDVQSDALTGSEITIERDGEVYNAAIRDASGQTPIGNANACISGDSVFIYGVNIEERYRRKGFGRRLVTELIKKITEELPDKKICLQVSSDNIPAVELYKSLGFETVSSLAYIKAV